jgi:hypothetical protein
MDRTQKLKLFSLIKADANMDIGLINQFSRKELKPEDVFCFSVILCDNDVDRDNERFTVESLEALAPLFLGKTGISDHRWTAENQVARLYRVKTEQTGETTALGDPKVNLRGDAYMLDNESNKAMIEAIDGGIIKEVSVGCSMRKCDCSICGEPLALDFRTWQTKCKNDHVLGEEYDGRKCVGELKEPTDAYEFSFVAVPSQRNAGVTKTAEELNAHFDALLEADLNSYEDKAKALLPRLQMVLLGAEDRAFRAKILEENEKFKLKRGKN